jgi:hypothetical protein
MQWTGDFISLDLLVGVTRIVFGLMFLVKLYFSVDACELNWAHRRPTWNGSEWPFYLCVYSLFAATVCFTLGIFTGPAAFLMWVLYVYLYRLTSIFGLEDNVFHALGLYYIFAGAGASLSLDRWLGIETWGRFPPNTVLPELIVTTVFGMIFLSAGVAKVLSPMWRRGLGVYYFFLLPLHRRTDTSFLTKRKRLMVFLNYLVLGMQFAVLPAFLLNAVPLGLTVWFLLLGFAILLSTVFVFTWLGESLIVGLIIVLWLLLDSGTNGLGHRWVQEFLLLRGGWERFWGCALLGALAACLWTAVVPHVRPQVKTPFFAFVGRCMRHIARFAWGFVPVNLFGERHTQGPVIYRVFAHLGTGLSQEVFRIFSPQCTAGPERIWRPTFIEVTQYKVAEACMEMDLYGEIRNETRRDFILKLAQYIAQRTNRVFGSWPSSLVFQTLQLVPPPEYAGADSWYLNEPWTDSFCVDFDRGKAQGIRVLRTPILKAPTGRDIARVSFAFNARSG